MPSIFLASSGASSKSPSRFALMRAGVFDLGRTEWPFEMPHARAT